MMMTDRVSAARHALRGILNIIGLIILVLLSVAVAVVALGSGVGVVALPYEMFLLAEDMPVVFRAHMVTSAVALLLAPVVIALRGHVRLHRWLGRLVGAFVVLGGLTALPVALFSHSSAMARAGFFVQGLVWLGLFAAGFAAIRRGERVTHIKLMIAMFAVTTGAVWFRVITGSAIAFDLPFAPVYAAAAWLGWLLPLAIVVCFPAVWRGFSVTRLP